MIEDKFTYHPDQLDSPPRHAYDVVPSDSVDLPFATRGIMVATAGSLRVTFVGGETVTLPALAAGMTHAARLSRIWLTGTTATGIVALY